MESETHEINKKLTQLARDVALIKQMLLAQKSKDPEGELSDWTKQELAEARAEPASSHQSLEEVEHHLRKKWTGNSN